MTRTHVGELGSLLLFGTLVSAVVAGCGAERAPSASAPQSTAAPAAAPPPPPPATPAAAASAGGYATIEDAQRELAEAERKLTAAGERQSRRTITAEQKPADAQAQAQERGIGAQQAPGRSGQQAGPRQQQAAPAKPGARKEAPAAPAQADRGGDAVAEKDKSKKAEGKNDDEAELSESPCAVACRALTSMKRAAEAVCRLAGEGDARCADARKRVSESATRVASCACEP